MKRPYSVRLAISDLAIGATDTDGHQLEAGEHFVAESATMMVAGATLASITEAASLKPLVLVNLKDNTSGQGMFSSPVPLSSIAGDGKNPFFFSIPLRFKSKPYLEAENISTDVAYKRVYLVLNGYLIRERD